MRVCVIVKSVEVCSSVNLCSRANLEVESRKNSSISYILILEYCVLRVASSVRWISVCGYIVVDKCSLGQALFILAKAQHCSQSPSYLVWIVNPSQLSCLCLP